MTLDKPWLEEGFRRKVQEDVWTSGPGTHARMRLTHLPTGKYTNVTFAATRAFMRECGLRTLYEDVHGED